MYHQGSKGERGEPKTSVRIHLGYTTKVPSNIRRENRCYNAIVNRVVNMNGKGHQYQDLHWSRSWYSPLLAIHLARTNEAPFPSGRPDSFRQNPCIKVARVMKLTEQIFAQKWHMGRNVFSLIRWYVLPMKLDTLVQTSRWSCQGGYPPNKKQMGIVEAKKVVLYRGCGISKSK